VSDTEHRADLPDIEADPWTRFDMWAQRAHDHMLEAIEIERTRGDNESSCALADMHDHAAYVAHALASASAPHHHARNRNTR